MTAENPTNNCLTCNKPLKGRSDKKFCNDYCRNTYNNQLKGVVNNSIRNINHILQKNRRILESLIAPTGEMGKIQKQKLLDKGFNFKHITHIYTNKAGNNYYFCYEYGYLPLEKDWYLIVKRKEEK